MDPATFTETALELGLRIMIHDPLGPGVFDRPAGSGPIFFTDPFISYRWVSEAGTGSISMSKSSSLIIKKFEWI